VVSLSRKSPAKIKKTHITMGLFARRDPAISIVTRWTRSVRFLLKKSPANEPLKRDLAKKYIYK